MTTDAPAAPAPLLVVKVTCGSEAPERCNQALTVAATAAASGATVSLWLTGEAVQLAREDATGFSLPHASDPLGLLEAVLADGAVTACTQCVARRSLTQEDLRPGVRIAGSAVFVAEALVPGTTALVY